ncbi:30S ribosomal protein S8 [Candidatus Karelsulcia muelleri]|uniref:30S ribosomal protein S8 n=1 Tax=Candidatus Karelsulcia muelleri TaxID=336810 RepID=UPI002363F326|nr:30S ribosomal protein S8 [Candidatus Karelsulcia muelleri]WDE42291.1 30S ribosomal protein S8 [Candidatus Karelsulcia muelleri]WDR79172.1 30S ribosomal protein S8 [Candidatus Karelsulcia muelleri]
MITDQISDCLTRIRNGCIAKKDTIYIPYSKIKTSIIQILFEQGFIVNYNLEIKKNQKSILVELKYIYPKKQSVIKYIKRISKPSFRKYSSSKNLPRVINGLGIAIISTSKGIITDKLARTNKIGGEIICYVY